ncbi:nuclear transport factor 2 family protein [Spirosoma rigui]|uniref:nuclear transport factor 2 family protein n=1 Tax=Spirosoma rigui TaxID=564064 RepID=UPI0009AF3919|nr:nuclear transport factor 2 family protein [Spirosoma rigui]
MDYQLLLRQLYRDFNARHIDAVLTHLHTDVAWPNGWEGGSVTGQEEVRAYWLRQWQEIDPEVLPTSFETGPNGQIKVGVRQIIRDLSGQVLSDSLLMHTYTFVDGKVKAMVIETY